MRADDKPVIGWRECVISNDLPPTTRHVLLTLSLHMDVWGRSCYPTIEQLAFETGLSKRCVMTHLAEAERLGWLVKRQHGFAGQRWRNHEYEARIPSGVKPNPWVGKRRQAGEPAAPASAKGGEPHAQGGEPNDTKVVKEVHPSSPYSRSVVVDTSVPPSAKASPSAARMRVTDHERVIELYHELLPELTRVVVSRWPDSAHAKHLAARWAEDPRFRSENFWRDFFGVVRKNDWWMGRKAGSDGQPWTGCKLSWLVKRSNFDRVLEAGGFE